jgi:hypothetical protein
MKPALHSWSFRERFRQQPGFDLFQALDQTAAMGFDSIEIMAGKAGGDAGDFAATDPAYLDQVATRARDNGVTIHCIAPYNDFCYVADEQWRLANIAYIRDWLHIAADMAVPNVRVMTGYRVEGVPASRQEQMVIDGFRELAPAAEQVGVNMALENHSSCMSGAADILRLLDAVGSDRLTTCPDPTNFCAGFFKPEAQPADREAIYDQTATMAPRATNSHLKVLGVGDDGELLGVDVPRLLGIYAEAGYDGPLHFEAVARDGDLLAPLPAARAAVQQAIDAAAG